MLYGIVLFFFLFLPFFFFKLLFFVDVCGATFFGKQLNIFKTEPPLGSTSATQLTCLIREAYVNGGRTSVLR